MSFSPEIDLLREYIGKRRLLEKSLRSTLSEKRQSLVLKELELRYAQLLNLRHDEIKSNVSLRLQTLQKRLENILELLALWQQYVELIYMPDWELGFFKAAM